MVVGLLFERLVMAVLLALHIRLEINSGVDETDFRAFADEAAVLHDA
jgi:hypothetical protein